MCITWGENKNKGNVTPWNFAYITHLYYWSLQFSHRHSGCLCFPFLIVSLTLKFVVIRWKNVKHHEWKTPAKPCKSTFTVICFPSQSLPHASTNWHLTCAWPPFRFRLTWAQPHIRTDAGPFQQSLPFVFFGVQGAALWGCQRKFQTRFEATWELRCQEKNLKNLTLAHTSTLALENPASVFEYQPKWCQFCSRVT